MLYMAKAKDDFPIEELPEDYRLISIANIAVMTGLGETKVRELAQAANFPHPVRFGRQLRYRLSEIKAWIDRQQK